MNRPLVLSTALLLAGAVAVACSDATAPGRTPSTFSVVASSAVYPLPAPTVQATSGSIVVDGVLVTPDPCFSVSGNASTSNDTLVVRITGKDKNVACEQVLVSWHYVLTVQSRPDGVNAIRVIHDRGVGTPTVALEQALP